MVVWQADVYQADHVLTQCYLNTLFSRRVLPTAQYTRSDYRPRGQQARRRGTSTTQYPIHHQTRISQVNYIRKHYFIQQQPLSAY